MRIPSGIDQTAWEASDVMRVTRLVGIAAMALAAVTCGPEVTVRTTVSPDAQLQGLRTFSIMRVPTRRGARRPSALDPMIYNSATNRALRSAIREGFEDRGYTYTEDRPDFEIAYYASARDKLDVTRWDYGYPWRPRWTRWGRAEMVTVYTEGTVIVDAVDPRTTDLLWRGRGISVVSDDPPEFRKDLKATVAAIIERFPAAEAMIARGR